VALYGNVGSAGAIVESGTFNRWLWRLLAELVSLLLLLLFLDLSDDISALIL
jgi:hypothetical protein